MGLQIGSGYDGSESIQTSVANQEILSAPYKKFYKFALLNKADCTIIVNNNKRLFLGENQGFAIDVTDQPITSIKFEQSGIVFNWVGAYM